MVESPQVLLAWESQNWKEIPVPKLDPLILRQTAPDSRFAAVLKAWDISAVEHTFLQQLVQDQT